MEWICPSPAQYKTIYPQNIFHQFVRINQNTQKLQKEIIKYGKNQDLTNYQSWNKTKVKAKDFYQIVKDLRQQELNFKDPDFLHINSNIGSQDDRQIKWLRIAQFIDNPVFANQNSLQGLQQLKCSSKSLQNALTLMARVNPKKFVTMISQDLIDQGIYRFRFFKQGIIEDVIIDDYIPTYKGVPLYVGPVRINQVFPILIEKALAKAFGNYQNIPLNTQTLLQVIFCGAVRKQQLNNFNTQQQMNKIITQSINSKCLILLQSKQQSKIQHYGINSNSLYQLINYYPIKLDNKRLIIFQLISQNKLSAWNGKFSINDDIWNKVSEKDKIFMEIKKNRSFCICQNDILKLFKTMIIFQDNNASNKDWIESVSKNNGTELINFTLKKKDRVYLRSTTNQKIRQSLILTQQLSMNQFRYLDGNYEQASQTCQLVASLPQGNYTICLFHEWSLKIRVSLLCFYLHHQKKLNYRGQQILIIHIFYKIFYWTTLIDVKVLKKIIKIKMVQNYIHLISQPDNQVCHFFISVNNIFLQILN